MNEQPKERLDEQHLATPGWHHCLGMFAMGAAGAAAYILSSADLNPGDRPGTLLVAGSVLLGILIGLLIPIQHQYLMNPRTRSLVGFSGALGYFLVVLVDHADLDAVPPLVGLVGGSFFAALGVRATAQVLKGPTEAD